MPFFPTSPLFQTGLQLATLSLPSPPLPSPPRQKSKMPALQVAGYGKGDHGTNTNFYFGCVFF